MTFKKTIFSLFLTGVLAAPVGSSAETAETPDPDRPIVTAGDVDALYAFLVDLEKEGLSQVSWHDMNRDGVPEAFVALMPDEDGRTGWSLYAPDPAGPRTVISDSGKNVTVIESDGGEPTRIVSDNISWTLTADGPRPIDDVLMGIAQRATSPGPDEFRLLSHMGFQNPVRNKVDVYRLDLIPGKGGDRIIVISDPVYRAKDGSSPYMILDEHDRILLSGLSVDRPFIFSADGDPVEIVELRDGGVRIRQITMQKIQ